MYIEVCSFVPVILHVIVVNVLNKLYSWAARRLTDHENHRTEGAHQNSLIIKRFLLLLLRMRMNNELNFPPNFERLVLGCVDADLSK